MKSKHIWIFTLILLGCEKDNLKWNLDKLPSLATLVSTNNCNSTNGFNLYVEQATPNGSQAWYIDAGYINNGLKVTSCFGGYVEFSMNLSSITKMIFWAKGSRPSVTVDGTLINTTMIQEANNTWMQLKTQDIASGAHTIKIDFPRIPAYRTIYVDEIEFYEY